VEDESVEDEMEGIRVDTWLYGTLARFGGEANQGGFAHLEVALPVGSTMADLLACLGMPADARGITFINGQLSAMPGLQPDLTHLLHAGDRVGFFDPKSMWPFQYRHGAALVPELAAALGDDNLHHTYRSAEEAGAAG